MTVTVVALVTINEDAPLALAQYLEATGPLLEAAGARIVSRFTVDEAVVGDRPARTLVMVEYPDRAAVDAVFGSETYRAAIPARDRAFSDYRISVVTNRSGPGLEELTGEARQ